MSSLRDFPGPALCHRDLMLATPGKLFSAPGWLFELKYDGFRCLVTKCAGTVRLESRRGRDMSPYFPELVSEIAPMRGDFVADAELVILDDRGCPQWDRLQKRHVLRRADRIKQAALDDPAALFCFDLLWLNGADFRPRPLIQRKDALSRLLPGNRRIRCAAHFEGSHVELWQLANALQLEGIMAKDAASTYSAGRTTRWQKIKTEVGAERELKRRP